MGNTYKRGDYVFAISSKADDQKSMYIAQKVKEFIAKRLPRDDLKSGNWVEFHAPRGERSRWPARAANRADPPAPRRDARAEESDDDRTGPLPGHPEALSGRYSSIM